jgi:hypothetical protein
LLARAVTLRGARRRIAASVGVETIIGEDVRQ